MRLVNRETFLTLPPDTLYAKVDRHAIGPLEIKGETIGESDWSRASLVDFDCDSSDDWHDTFERLYAGESVRLSTEEYGRDGCYDADAMFLVLERADLWQVVCAAHRAIVATELVRSGA